MYTYNIFQWILFFYIYSIVGWIIESSIVSIQNRKFVNQGFLRGPMLPIYGSGAIIILLVTLPAKDNFVLVFLFGMIAATVLEYITSWIMDCILKMKYWDYSTWKFNLNGRICLLASLFWGALALFLTYVIHKPIEKLVLSFSSPLTITVMITISVIFITDSVFAFKTALNVNKILSKITEIRTELEQLRQQLNEKIENKLENSAHYEEIKARIQKLKDEKDIILSKLSFFKRDFIKAHPSAVSRNFNNALTELREKLNQKINDKK